MSTRREARELALQALYQADLGEGGDRERGLMLFWSHFNRGQEVDPFARELVEGVLDNQERIDAIIGDVAERWKLPRLSRVDLSMLRLGTYELMARPEIPASVTINEAIEIARRFGSEDSASFVNGVLDAIAAQLGVKDRERSGRTDS
jgi:transcription antitermination protein NusB